MTSFAETAKPECETAGHACKSRDRGHIGVVMRNAAAAVAIAILGFSAMAPEPVTALPLPVPAATRHGASGLIVLVQGRRDDPAAPIITLPGRKRGGLFSNSPFASPTAPVIRSDDLRKPTAPVISTPPGSAEGADAELPGIPEGQAAPPYEKEILRLAELLGSLHYLRGLCGANEGGLWRDEMERLVEAEPDNAVWRARLKQSFNGGYSGFNRTYQTCTPSAARAASLFIDEGKTLVATIRTRYAY